MRWRAHSSDGLADIDERPAVLIICYGNRLRCDDGLAWHAAEQLNRLFSPAKVRIITCHQLTPELCETLHRANTVFFIDAGSDGSPGELRFIELGPESFVSPLDHTASPAALVTLCHKLWGSAPRAFLVSLSGACFDFGESLSPQVIARIPYLTNVVVAAVDRLSGTKIRSLSARP